MKRLSIPPRTHWRDAVERVGFQYHSMDEVYWNERVCYQFTAEEIDYLEETTAELHRLCREAIQYILAEHLLSPFHVPLSFAELVHQSWDARHFSLYGRFDLFWNGTGDAKLLEYNADTPTSLLEQAVVQWFWLQDVFPRHDQFNSTHEQLIEQWTRCPTAQIHFTGFQDHLEDLNTLEYLMDTCSQAGKQATFVHIEEIQWHEQNGFLDAQHHPMLTVFKLYPWEWLIRDPFGAYIPRKSQVTQWIEPAWKMLLSCKSVLPILWKLFPDHPNLAPTFFTAAEAERAGVRHVVTKPRYGREGANVRLASGEHTEGPYGDEGLVYQQQLAAPCFDGHYPVIGSWIIGERPTGIGIRESATPITNNLSHFVPHCFS